jgi:hypothetical protein
VLVLLSRHRPDRNRADLQYDWDGNGVINTASKVNDPVNCPTGTAACRGEQVTYSLVGTQLMRREIRRRGAAAGQDGSGG